LGNWNVLTTIAGRFTTPEQVKMFTDFIQQNKIYLVSALDSLNSAADAANANLEWDDKYMSEFIKHLHKLNSATAKAISVVLGMFSLLFLYLFN
jgi:hypothetical protein